MSQNPEQRFRLAFDRWLDVESKPWSECRAVEYPLEQDYGLADQDGQRIRLEFRDARRPPGEPRRVFA